MLKEKKNACLHRPNTYLMLGKLKKNLNKLTMNFKLEPFYDKPEKGWKR